MRTNAYTLSAEDIMSVSLAAFAQEGIENCRINKIKMIGILHGAMLNIEKMALKNNVSQFPNKSSAWVSAYLRKLAVTAYHQYFTLVKNGGTLKDQKRFVKLFAKGPNHRAIKAESRSRSAI